MPSNTGSPASIVVTEADRPEYESLRLHLLVLQRLVNAAWNMQRCLKLKNLVMESIGGLDPLAHPDSPKAGHPL